MFGQIKQSCEKFPDRNAFCISNTYYTYSQLAQKISNIRYALEQKNKEQLIGVIINDDIETYASIFGILFSGSGFVPINPRNPVDRNVVIIKESGVKIILSGKTDERIDEIKTKSPVRFLFTNNLPDVEINLSLPQTYEEDNAYLFFTSGSTGVPKGVPISHKNLNSFVDAFFNLSYQIGEHDRFLQMFDLTFDLSLMSYIIPLGTGACVYTVNPDEIKYTAVYSLLEEKEITFALMVPSILSYLKPYFEDIKLEKMKYSLFCGEALHSDITKEWAACVPNALIQNVYGPTEATIFCLTYDWDRKRPNKEFNGIVCIGKPMKDMHAIIVDDNLNLLPEGEKGELCLAGNQVTAGYWNNPEKNKEAFLTCETDDKEQNFYRTGDIAFVDKDGDFMYCGRVDQQVQIQGFRVELSEIEHYVRQHTGLNNVAVIAYTNNIGNTEIHLFVENYQGAMDDITEHLKSKVPEYMLPSEITSLPAFPFNVNGKIDMKALSDKLQ